MLLGEAGDHGGDVCLLPLQVGYGLVHNGCGKSVAAGNVQSPALSRNSSANTVGGSQGGLVEFRRGVGTGGVGVAVVLQHTVVGGHHHQIPLLDEPVQHRHGYGSPFLWIGTASQLVQQHQALSVGMLQHLADVPHVAGKGGEGLVQGLLVSNVRKDTGAEGKGSTLRCWKWKAALIQQGKKGQGFQGDSFSPCVWPRNDENPAVRGKNQINGNGLLSQQGMAGLQETGLAFRGQVKGKDGLVAHCPSGGTVGCVKLYHNAVGQDNVVAEGGKACRQVPENTADFR